MSASGPGGWSPQPPPDPGPGYGYGYSDSAGHPDPYAPQPGPTSYPPVYGSAYPPGPYGTYPAAPTSPPGQTLGIVGLVISIAGTFLWGTSLIGMIISIIALVQSRQAGAKNGVALAGVIVGGAVTVLGVAAIIAYFALLIPFVESH